MRRSSVKHRLISRTSELFAGDPELPVQEFAESTDISAVVASQGKAVPKRDHKSLCNVLFSDKKGKQKGKPDDQTTVLQNSSVLSTQVSCDF